MKPMTWRKSSRSSNNGSNCVEARVAAGIPQLSDSKLAEVRPILAVDRDTFTGFLATIKAGELD